ncbi:hypothetical protein MTO96_001212 [Rhipicephalus appendiculatus]
MQYPEGEELVQQSYSHKAAELSLEQGCLHWSSRVVISQSLRSRVLQLLHVGHPGVVEKIKIVAQYHVWWPGLDQNIAHMVQSCQVCQEHQRALRQVEISPWPFPQRPLVSPSRGFWGLFKGHYFLVVVDAFSKWLKFYLLPLRRPHTLPVPDHLHNVTDWMMKTPLEVLHPDLQSTALLKKLKQKLAADRGCRPGPLPEPAVPLPRCSYICRTEPWGTSMLTMSGLTVGPGLH